MLLKLQTLEDQKSIKKMPLKINHPKWIKREKEEDLIINGTNQTYIIHNPSSLQSDPPRKNKQEKKIIKMDS